MEINKNVITMSQVQVPEPEKREKPPVLTTNTIQPHEFPRGEKPAGPAAPMITTENVERVIRENLKQAAVDEALREGVKIGVYPPPAKKPGPEPKAK